MLRRAFADYKAQQFFCAMLVAGWVRCVAQRLRGMRSAVRVLYFAASLGQVDTGDALLDAMVLISTSGTRSRCAFCAALSRLRETRS